MNSSTLSLTELERALVTANAGFAERLRRIGAGDWVRSTPCSEWDVRALVNHVIGANVRYRLLLRGASLAQVEATRHADHLGDDPAIAFEDTARAVIDCFRTDGVLARQFRHISGERTGRELLVMRILDLGVHSWDLATAIGVDATIDADVVAIALTATTPSDDEGRDTSPQDRLLLRLGRRPTEGGTMVTEVEEFLSDVLPRLQRTETALHNGDAGPRLAMWSHEDPVTLFGAALAGRGWNQVSGVFEHIAQRFSDCESCEWEVVAAGASGDLAYIVAIERTVCSIADSPPSPYSLRSTSVFRREAGEWKVVHRHADPNDPAAAPLLRGLEISRTSQ